MRPVIAVDKLCKQYRIGGKGSSGYRTLRESLSGGIEAVARRLWKSGNKRSDACSPEEVWALRDVSFQVRAGEVVGIIGRNGAGKSTLLKILSRITQPTQGQIELRGRVGSLLEVGTGFHPELTGRENIFLNGAILGMARKEIERKFDAIVAFAEIDRFLDTPVKRYSSGMYTRLAFAVASHLEPEILIVDEVLAVGDTEFQQKCLGRMNEVSREGRTVLFVSHNLTAVKSLCSRAVLVEGGRVAMDGSVDNAVDRYLTGGNRMAQTGIIPEDAPRLQDRKGEAMFRSVQITDSQGNSTNQLYFRQAFKVSFVCDILKDIPDGHFEISISTVDGTQVTYSTTMDGGNGSMFLRAGRHEVTADFEGSLLPRQYTIDVGVHHHCGATSDMVQRTLDFTVLRVAESGNDHYLWPRTRGFVRASAKWS